MAPWLSRDHGDQRLRAVRAGWLLEQLRGSVGGGRGGAAGAADRPPFAQSERTHSSSHFEPVPPDLRS